MDNKSNVISLRDWRRRRSLREAATALAVGIALLGPPALRLRHEPDARQLNASVYDWSARHVGKTFRLGHVAFRVESPGRFAKLSP